jgi:hypothetical protein
MCVNIGDSSRVDDKCDAVLENMSRALWLPCSVCVRGQCVQLVSTSQLLNATQHCRVLAPAEQHIARCAAHSLCESHSLVDYLKGGDTPVNELLLVVNEAL